MNWLPRASLYQEAEAARAKRKANMQAVMQTNAAMSSTFIGIGTSVSGEAVNLTIRIAAERIQKAVAKLR